MAPYFVHRFLPKRSRDARFAAVFDGLLYEYSFLRNFKYYGSKYDFPHGKKT